MIEKNLFKIRVNIYGDSKSMIKLHKRTNIISDKTIW